MSQRNLDSPQQLWEYFTGYESTLPTIEVPQSHVKLGIVYLPIKAPMTMEGFKSYLWDIGVGDIKRYIDNSEGNFNEYVPIITRIKEKIFANNLSKAAVGLYKENLIARQLGMSDKSETKSDVNINTYNADFGQVIQSPSKPSDNTSGDK